MRKSISYFIFHFSFFIFLITLFLFNSALLQAQGRLSQGHLPLEKPSPSTKQQSQLNSYFEKATIVRLPIAEWYGYFAENNAPTVDFSLSETESWQLILQRKSLISPQYKASFTSEKGEFSVADAPSLTFRGTTQEKRSVFITLSQETIHLTLEGESSRWHLVPLYSYTQEEADKGLFVWFNQADVLTAKPLVCGFDTKALYKKAEEKATNRSTVNNPNGCLVLEVATDADYEYFVQEGSVMAVNDAIIHILNQVDAAFEVNFSYFPTCIYHS